MKLFLVTILSIFIISSCSNNKTNNNNNITNNDSIKTKDINVVNDSVKTTIIKDTMPVIDKLTYADSNKTIINNTITKETSKSPCIITKIYTIKNNNFIVVDYTRITDKEEEESGMPIYENKNPKLRTFLINDSTEITIFDWEKNTDTGVWKISLKEFLSNKENQISDYTKWNISVKDGIVKKLNEIYYP